MIAAYDRHGDGSPLVLLHGTGGSRAVWAPISPLLEPHRDVLVPDLPGCGGSPPFPSGVRATVAAYAAAVEGWLDQLGLHTVAVAGNSLGGQVAFELAARGRATSVVALSPTGFWNGTESLYTRALVRVLRASAIMSLPVVSLLARNAPGRQLLLGSSVARPRQVPPADAARIVVALAHSDAPATNRDANRERLGGERTTPWRAPSHDGLTRFASRLDGIPVTIAWAEHDRFLPLRQAARARDAFPLETHVTLEGCGHFSMWDDPATVANVILSGTEPARSQSLHREQERQVR